MKKLLPFLVLATAATQPIVPFGGSQSTPAHPGQQKNQPAPAQAPVPVQYPKVIIPPSDKMAPALTKLPDQVSGELFYYPGVVVASGGKWSGGDNFVNLSKAIAVQVNFVKAEGVDITFTQDKYQSLISTIFGKNGFTTSPSTSPPLPFFNLIVLIFPTADGLAAAIQGRLFEQVTVARVQLKDEAFQAITWEQTHLVYGATDEFEKQLTSTIDSLVNTFITRVKAHESVK